MIDNLWSSLVYFILWNEMERTLASERCANFSLITRVLSGSMAGLSVDIILFPLDTIKTRLQSADGFAKSGGFRGIYRGIGSTAVGSVPGAALFFGTYEAVKHAMHCDSIAPSHRPLVHMLAACCGETIACVVRVPTEVVKQRTMISTKISSFNVLVRTIRSEGIFGLYRGYFSTVFREIPFSLLQFPVWEYLKTRWAEQQHALVLPWQSSICGAVAGGFSAAVTTPLDVAKTRIMLAKVGSDEARGNVWKTLLIVHHQKGLSGLFSGLIPRVLWISLGGAIFLGVYDKVKLVISESVDRQQR